ncbi:cytochrome-c peroxidase [Pseudomonas aeruginosa]|uniref:cytochrome-c peroxidase n=1 Tax=Pseudomonas aeruginosa TaxID=287 RepID=UPI002AA5E0D0|nr:cytochrome c peroxidase [Pseudomonas aeruginosa]MDY7164974.1 cytochrome c peroxidase [Pseudomonas aeruginosa]
MQSSQLLPLGSLLLSFATPLAQADALHDQASALFKPIPEQVTELRGQPISEQQRELGKKLFFDPRLSRSHVLSCNTCHNVGTGGADNVPTSVGHGWQKGPRNSPTVFNAVFNAAQFWDGRAKDLGEQAKGPIQNSVCSAARNSSACCAINPTRLVFQWWKRNFRIARRVPPGYPN